MSASVGEGGAKGRSCAPVLRPAIHSWCLLLAMVILLLAAACAAQRPSAQQTPEPSQTPAAPQVTAAPGGESAASVPATAAPAASVITLTIWGPDFMAPLPDVPGGAVLAAQINSFVQAHPSWQVHYVRKKPYGEGGLIHFLRSTQAVAPQSLPDLVLLDMSEVGWLVDADLLQPLDNLLGADIMSDLMPYAREAGQVGDHLLAAQYEADIRFLAYNSAIVGTPPATWGEILALGPTYLLPIGNSEGAVRDAFLPQYLALGGKLTDRDGRPYLDRAVVTRILEVYQSARQANLLPAAGLELKDASDCWPVYLTGGAPASSVTAAMTNVNSWDYGRDRGRLAKTRIAPLPTLSGTLISLSNGWGWVLLARDAGRQEAAGALLRSLLEPEAMAAWSRATYHLPARRSALPLAVSDQEYLRFLQRLTEVTVPQPREPNYSLALEALRPAIENVTRGTATPLAAAAEAADRMHVAQQKLQPDTQQ